MNNVAFNVGDVVIFEAGDDLISTLIALLTNSRYSHAAMIYSKDCIVEMGLSGISTRDITSSLITNSEPEKGNCWLRFEPSDSNMIPLNTDPLYKAAKKYVDDDINYDFPALILIAGLLICQHLRHTDKMTDITYLIIRRACWKLDELLKGTETTMICSQLVYQVYLDCGKDYMIKLSGAALQVDHDSKNICLADMLDRAPEFEGDIMIQESDDTLTDDALLEKLLGAWQEHSKDDATLLSDDKLGKILSVANEFSKKLLAVSAKANLDIPMKSVFVTPEDLANNAENLEKLGFLDIS